MLVVNIRTETDAFKGEMGDDWATHVEVARLLREIATRVERGEATGKFQTVFDVHGNDVGRWKLDTPQ